MVNILNSKRILNVDDNVVGLSQQLNHDLAAWILMNANGFFIE